MWIDLYVLGSLGMHLQGPEGVKDILGSKVPGKRAQNFCFSVAPSTQYRAIGATQHRSCVTCTRNLWSMSFTPVMCFCDIHFCNKKWQITGSLPRSYDQRIVVIACTYHDKRQNIPRKPEGKMWGLFLMTSGVPSVTGKYALMPPLSSG